MTKEEFDTLPPLTAEDCVEGTVYVSAVTMVPQHMTADWAHTLANHLAYYRTNTNFRLVSRPARVGDLLTRENARVGMVYGIGRKRFVLLSQLTEASWSCRDEDGLSHCAYLEHPVAGERRIIALPESAEPAVDNSTRFVVGDRVTLLRCGGTSITLPVVEAQHAADTAGTWRAHLETCEGEWQRRAHDVDVQCPRCGVLRGPAPGESAAEPAVEQGNATMPLGMEAECDGCEALIDEGEQNAVEEMLRIAKEAADRATTITIRSAGWPVQWDGIPSAPEQRQLGCRHGYLECTICDYDRRYYAEATNAACKTEEDFVGERKRRLAEPWSNYATPAWLAGIVDGSQCLLCHHLGPLCALHGAEFQKGKDDAAR